MTKLVKFDSFMFISNGVIQLSQTDRQPYRQRDATQIIGALTHFSVKYLTMPNTLTFSATTVITRYGKRHTCMLKATDLLLIKLSHMPVT
jgi:hypothetical protein